MDKKKLERVKEYLSQYVYIDQRLQFKIDKDEEQGLTEIKNEIKGAIYSLPLSMERLIIERRYMLGHSVKEICIELDISDATYYNKFNDACAKIYEVMNDRAM